MKRTATIALLAMLLLPALAQQVKYQVSGTMPPALGTVYLFDQVKEVVIDSMRTADGTFSFTRMAPANTFYGVGNQTIQFVTINDGKPITIDFQRGTLKGSPLNEKLHYYDLKSDSINRAMRIAYMAQDGIRLDSLQEVLIDMMKQAARENPDNVIPALYMTYVGYTSEYEELKELLKPEFAYYDHELSKIARMTLADFEVKAPGKPFIDMEMEDTRGMKCKLSDWCGKGRYVLIDFWASWCGPCMKEMPNVIANYQKYHPLGFEIVGVSLDQDKGQWINTLSRLGMRWPQMSDLKGWESIAVETWGIHSIPTSVLVGPDGKIVALNLREEELGKKLKEIYGQ